MAQPQHRITTEPVKDDFQKVTWTAECSCGKWTAAGPREVQLMVAHNLHIIRTSHSTPHLSARLDAIERGRKE